MTTDERLIALEIKVDELIKKMDNHLVHYFKYNIMAWSVTLIAIIGLMLK